MSQADINQFPVVLARRHQKVVRLKGGDPLVLRSGSEEVPIATRQGVISASGCTAHAPEIDRFRPDCMPAALLAMISKAAGA